jgi:hypothetical protein
MCALKDGQSVVIDSEPEQDTSHEPSGPRIRCPLCGWSPSKEDRWACECGHLWNTFDTGGCARRAFTNGLRPSVSSVADGRRIPIGMRSNEAAGANGFQESSDTMNGYEGESILGQRGCSAGAFLALQLSLR